MTETEFESEFTTYIDWSTGFQANFWGKLPTGIESLITFAVFPSIRYTSPENELEMLINDEAWTRECDNSDPGDELEMLINNEARTRECDKKGEGI